MVRPPSIGSFFRAGRTRGARWRDIESLEPEKWAAIWDVSAERYASREDVLRAAKGIGRREAQEAICALLHDVAAADVVAPVETSLLDHLAGEWGISI